MTTNLRIRRSRATRPVAATMATVLLGLSLAAGFHRGGHDDLGWLPHGLHHHDFQWAAEAAGDLLPAVEHCLACHVSRTLVRFVTPAPAVPEAPIDAAPVADASADRPSRSDFPRTSRAPPA